MSDIVEFEGVKVAVTYAPKLKHSYLRVNADSTISVKTPIRSSSFIYHFLEDKKSWINKQLDKNRQNQYQEVKLEDEVLLFGEIYSVDSPQAIYLRKRLSKSVPKEDAKIIRAYNDFYKQYAQEYLPSRVEYFAAVMGLEYKKLKFRKMKSRWGSCSSRKEITLNTQLMKLKKEFIDYVVVHELAHLVHMNHSKEFHSLVERYLPNSKNIRKQLREIRLL
jgi:hypothetical protein